MRTYTATATIDIQSLGVFEDGSGSPCIVKIADYVYALDLLGDVSLHCVKHPAGASQTASKVAAQRARAAYLAYIFAHTTEDWRETNRKMYTE
jgi:hypothetical protein